MTRAKMKAPEGFMTTEDAASKLGMKTQSLRVWSSQGGPICPVKFGTALFWVEAEVEGLLLKRKLPTSPKPRRVKKAQWTESEVSKYMKSIGGDCA
jgi:predicted DNA-binding transcriptional regulator AlpA